MMFCWWHLLLLLGSMEICRAQECDEFTKLGFHNALFGTTLRVRLLLYTRSNRDCGRELSHHNFSGQPLFNVSKPSVFIIHGYRFSGSPPVWLGELVSLLLLRGDMNALVVDWNRGSTNFNYMTTVTNTRLAADNLTAFIQNMEEHGASLDSIHMIGFSLGAHLSGFVGAKLNGRLGRITGLDPAGPMYTGTDPENRLDPTDAQLVDVMHTDIDSLGFRKTLGHIDFYVNGGADQPGCPMTIFSGEAYIKCDHQRSVYLFMDSLNRTCMSRAFPCSSYTDFLDGLCMTCDRFKPAGCPVFGYDVVQWKDTLVQLRSTQVYLTTNPSAPFCRTVYGVDIVTWNQITQTGYITITLHSGSKEAQAKINHKVAKFKQYTETHLLAQFDKSLPTVKKISLKFLSYSILNRHHKLRILRFRLTPLESSDRPLCRYDILLEGNSEVTFNPIPCEDSNF